VSTVVLKEKYFEERENYVMFLSTLVALSTS